MLPRFLGVLPHHDNREIVARDAGSFGHTKEKGEPALGSFRRCDAGCCRNSNRQQASNESVVHMNLTQMETLQMTQVTDEIDEDVL